MWETLLEFWVRLTHNIFFCKLYLVFPVWLQWAVFTISLYLSAAGNLPCWLFDETFPALEVRNSFHNFCFCVFIIFFFITPASVWSPENVFCHLQQKLERNAKPPELCFPSLQWGTALIVAVSITVWCLWKICCHGIKSCIQLALTKNLQQSFAAAFWQDTCMYWAVVLWKWNLWPTAKNLYAHYQSIKMNCRFIWTIKPKRLVIA